MVLDQRARGELEKYIDRLIRNIPSLMLVIRDKGFKNLLQSRDEEDFLYGAIFGGIYFGYAELFYGLFQKYPTQEEILEIQSVLVKRMREVKDAIFKAG